MNKLVSMIFGSMLLFLLADFFILGIGTVSKFYLGFHILLSLILMVTLFVIALQEEVKEDKK